MLLLCAAIVCVGCSATEPPQAENVPTPKVEVRQGMPVKLVLLRQLESGKANEGENVPFVVGSNVSQDGKVLIPEGSFATAVVTGSRGEGALSATVFNQPARLQVRFERLTTPDGQSIPIAANLEKPDEPFSFSRANTGPSQDEKSDAPLEEAKQQALAKIAEAFEKGTTPDLADISAETLSQIAEGPSSKLALQKGRLLDAFGLIGKVREAKTLSDLASGFSGGELGLALQAIGEVGRVASRTSDYLKGRFKGRNIRAYPGTEVTVYVAKPTEVTPAATR